MINSTSGNKGRKIDLCLVAEVHAQLLDEGEEDRLREGAGSRVEHLEDGGEEGLHAEAHLGGVEELAGEDNQGEVAGAEGGLEGLLDLASLDAALGGLGPPAPGPAHLHRLPHGQGLNVGLWRLAGPAQGAQGAAHLPPHDVPHLIR